MDTIWILGDQLSHTHAALTRYAPGAARVLMIESKARGLLERYHRLKLVLIYSAMRHFAAELRAAGWEVDYHLLPETPDFSHALRLHLERYQPKGLVLMEPNSFAETDAVQKLARKFRVPLTLLPTTHFLLSRVEFQQWAGQKARLLMENHYRRMRQRTGWLMEADGQPTGGAWNYDVDNRLTYTAWARAKLPPLEPLRTEPDAVTQEVMALVRKEFPGGSGDVQDFWLPVTRAEAVLWLERFIQERLPRFGGYEDTMAEGEPFLFHSVLSPLINIGLLSPGECAHAAVQAYRRGEAPLNSVEGYLRQIIGWREFINGVYWLRGPEYSQLNALGAERPLPAWFYTAETPMNCLHHVLRQTLQLGWNHHIQRLMILGNFCLVAGINPQQALRWFLEMYVDAFDWVMPANVVGMTLYADGGFMATKPYAATSTYIRKMSNYCRNCAFDPDQKTGPQACPYNFLYWHFMDQHTERFASNPRMKAIIGGWLKRTPRDQEAVRESAAAFLAEHVPSDQ